MKLKIVMILAMFIAATIGVISADKVFQPDKKQGYYIVSIYEDGLRLSQYVDYYRIDLDGNIELRKGNNETKIIGAKTVIIRGMNE